MSLLRLLPRFRQAQQQLRELSERETWSRAQIEAFQLKRLNRLWKTARREVPYYRSLVEEYRLPNAFANWEEFTDCMPILDKREVRTNPERFLRPAYQTGKWMRTGGSTGIPMRVYWGSDAHREMLRCKYRGEQAWGLDILDRKALLWGHRNSSAPGWRGWIERGVEPAFDWLRNRYRLSAYQLGPQDLDQHLNQMRRFCPRSIYGYSTAVMLLARQARARGISFPSLKLAILTGEPADEEMIAETAEGLGVSVAVEYGSCECGLLAYRYPDGLLKVREDVVRLETVPRPDGLYDVVVTVLNNPSFPLIRYAIEDMTSHPLERPAVGFSQLAGVVGRANDVLISRRGRIIHSMAVKHALENHPLVRRFRAVQQEDGRLNVDVEMTQGDVTALREGRDRLIELLEGYPVEMQRVEALPTSSAGKHRWIVCNLPSRELRSSQTVAPERQSPTLL